MDAQSVMMGSRVAHVRELKTEIEKLKAENARLRDESAALKAHFELAAAAAHDLALLGADGRFVIIDGWNLILGSERVASSREELFKAARAHLDARPTDFVWVVFDGPRPSSVVEGRLRVSYTGGAGPQRADRLVCDFLRMASLTGELSRIEVVTGDRNFRREASRLGARVR